MQTVKYQLTANSDSLFPGKLILLKPQIQTQKSITQYGLDCYKHRAYCSEVYQMPETCQKGKARCDTLSVNTSIKRHPSGSLLAENFYTNMHFKHGISHFKIKLTLSIPAVLYCYYCSCWSGSCRI